MGAVAVDPVQTSACNPSVGASPIAFGTGIDGSSGWAVYGGPAAVASATNAGDIASTHSVTAVELQNDGSFTNSAGGIGGGSAVVMNARRSRRRRSDAALAPSARAPTASPPQAKAPPPREPTLRGALARLPVKQSNPAADRDGAGERMRRAR
jgi:adhesin HecA-like repeat protein